MCSHMVRGAVCVSVCVCLCVCVSVCVGERDKVGLGAQWLPVASRDLLQLGRRERLAPVPERGPPEVPARGTLQRDTSLLPTSWSESTLSS